MYSFKQLELFVSLARTQRVVETAKEYTMSQSAVSMSIRELEKELREQLFDRIGKKLILNDRGHLLLQECSPSLEHLKDVYASFSDAQLRGELRISASATVADYFMPALINDYLSIHEGLHLRLKSANSSEVINRVQNGESDLGFIEGACSERNIECHVLMQDELIIVTCDRQFEGHAPLFIDQLLEKKWVMREEGSGTRSVFLNTIAPLDKELQVFMEFGSIEAIKNFLESGEDYFTVLPRICVESELKEKKLFEVKVRNISFERDFILVKRKERAESSLMKHFKAFVMQRFG